MRNFNKFLWQRCVKIVYIFIWPFFTVFLTVFLWSLIRYLQQMGIWNFQNSNNLIIHRNSYYALSEYLVNDILTTFWEVWYKNRDVGIFWKYSSICLEPWSTITFPCILIETYFAQLAGIKMHPKLSVVLDKQYNWGIRLFHNTKLQSCFCTWTNYFLYKKLFHLQCNLFIYLRKKKITHEVTPM